ncbi:hypothetical protein Daus18300_006871 [Diaporthe australafricana]|uniref:Clr5 domain-containing protein n=1 Tax=Diaporthe australafricana TaxID=127596 RepID=A0ABR3WRA4_9PEZI
MSERTYSPSYDSPEPEGPRTPPHKWNHFEVRALVCLIIKGEHRVSKDPMYITDILNRALNPASSGKKPAYNRDIPHDEVQEMLKRILLKKMHAVDVSERNVRSQVTRVKVNAFMRNLGFDGSKEEWKSGRAKEARVENQKRLTRYMIRKEGRRPSPRSQDETGRRRMLLREPRAKRLLRGWGIGASFWEGGSHGEQRSRNKNKDRDSSSSSETVVDPADIPYISDEAPPTPAGYALGRNDDSVIVRNKPGRSVATWAGGFAPAKATPMTSSIAPASMYGAGVSQHAPMLDYGSYGGFDGLYDLQQPPYQWDGGEQDGMWYGADAAGGQRLSTSSQFVGRKF